jgi:hypothetical protein
MHNAGLPNSPDPRNLRRLAEKVIGLILGPPPDLTSVERAILARVSDGGRRIKFDENLRVIGVEAIPPGWTEYQYDGAGRVVAAIDHPADEDQAAARELGPDPPADTG